jgi:hypothetical protein
MAWRLAEQIRDALTGQLRPERSLRDGAADATQLVLA